MTANWFEAKVKYVKINEDGRESKVCPSYLLDAMSYTEAEVRIMSEMESVISGDYYISNLKKSNITEVVPSEDENDDRWFKAKVAIIDADEISGKEKSSFTYYLVAASNIKRALENLEKALATFIVPYEIVSIVDTSIVDVFPCISNEVEVIPENLKPFDYEGVHRHVSEKRASVRTLEVWADVDWADISINGVPDVNGDLIPCIKGGEWCPIIDVDKGLVTNWEQGKTAAVHAKVFDRGIYVLKDNSGCIIKTRSGYAPKIMCPEEHGFTNGKYIVMNIDKDGFIANWNPCIDDFFTEED